MPDSDSLCLIAGTYRPKGGLVKNSPCESEFIKLVRKSEHHVVAFETVQGDAATRHAHFIVSVKSADKPTLNFGKSLRNQCERLSPDSVPTVAVHLRKCYKGEVTADSHKWDSYLKYLWKEGPPDVCTPLFESEDDAWHALAFDDVPLEDRRKETAWGEISKFVNLVNGSGYDVENVTQMEEAFMDLCYVKQTWMPKKSVAERRLFVVDAYLYHRKTMTSFEEVDHLTRALMPAKDRFDDMRRHDVELRRVAKKQKVCELCVHCAPSDMCEECADRHRG